MDKEEALKELGLNDREIKTYLALLRLGTSSVNKIARKATIIRTTAYDVLKALVEKGLASYVIKSGVKYYEAALPEKIISILDEKKKKILEVLLELNELRESVSEKPSVEIYEGKEGLKTILEDMLKTEENICGYTSVKLMELLNFYFPNFITRRAKLKIKTRIIMEKSKETEDLKKTGSKEFREVRFIENASKFRLGHYIYGNKVAILIAKKEQPMGILIDNEDLAEQEKAVFEQVWKIANK
jgi:HTH-type transcriptional regulator, sugar sensing transcriptional regulator